VVGITDTGIGIAPEDHDKVFDNLNRWVYTLTDKPKAPVLVANMQEIGSTTAARSAGSNSGMALFLFYAAVMKMEGIKHIHLNDLLGQRKSA
jgi:signal transduction histidine kinase